MSRQRGPEQIHLAYSMPSLAYPTLWLVLCYAAHLLLLQISR